MAPSGLFRSLTIFGSTRVGLKNKAFAEGLRRRARIMVVLDFCILLKLLPHIQQKPSSPYRMAPKKGVLRGYGRH